MKALHNFVAVFTMNCRQAWFHRKAALVSVATWVMRMGLTMILYVYIYRIRNGATVNGIDLRVAMSGMVLYAIVIGFGYRDLFKVINKEFKAGTIEVWLNKPISYTQLKSAETFGKNIPVVIGLVIAAAGFWLIGNQIPSVDNLSLRLLIGLLLLSLGLVIATLLYLIVGLSVVWILDAGPIYLILDKLIMIFGGAFIPIGFFPASLRLAGEVIPTGAAIYATQIFYPDFMANAPRFIATQLAWVAILVFAATKLSKAANLRLTVNGG